MVEFNEDTAALADRPAGGTAQAPQARQMPVRELAALLRADPEAVAIATLGEPTSRTRKELRFGRKGSLSVVIRGRKAGRWFDHEAGVGGDMLALVQRELGQAEGLEWARRWVGDNGAKAPVRNAPAARASPDDGADKAAKRADAIRLWSDAQPIGGTQAAAYLAARVPGADVLALVRPGVLRFVGRHRHTSSKRHFAVMVAKVTSGPDGEMLSVHRTYLHPDPDLPEKAPLRGDERMVLGSPEDGGAYLTKTRPRMLVGEGIETTLSGLAAVHGDGWGAVAALNTSGLKNLALAPEVRDVRVLVDVDKVDRHGKRPGEAAAREAAARWAAEGRRVVLAFPGPADGPPCDFNDLWREGGAAAVRAAIQAAEVVPDPAEGARERLLDELRAFIRKALPLVGAPPRGVREDIAASPLPVPVPFVAAEARAAKLVEDWVLAAARVVARSCVGEMATRLACHDLRELPADDVRRQPGPVREKFLGDAERRHALALTAALKAAGWWEGGGVPPPFVLSATTGLGKTEAAIRAVKVLRKTAPVRVPVTFLVRGYKQADELAQRLQKAEIPAKVLRGRNRNDDEGEPLCVRADLAGEAAALGLSVRRTVCERDGVRCWAHGTCGYNLQGQGIHPDAVIIATHDVLRTGELPSGGILRGVVIVDEHPGAALEAGRRLRGKMVALRAGADMVRNACLECAPLANVLGAVLGLLGHPELGGFGWQDGLIARGASFGALDETATAIRGAMPRHLGSPDEDGTILREMGVRGEAVAALRAWGAVLDSLLLDWRAGRPTVQSLERAAASSDEKVAGDDPPLGPNGDGPWDWIAHGPPHALPVGLPVMILDATADDRIARTLFGEKVRIEHIHVEQHVRVALVASPSFGKWALGLGKNPTDDERDRAELRLDDVWRLVAHLIRKRAPRKVGVIVYEALYRAWKDRAEAAGVVLGQFGNLRGLNEMEDCEVLVIVGRPLPGRREVESMARTIFANDPLPLRGLLPPASGGAGHVDFDVAAVGLHLDPPKAWGLEVPAHVDERVHAVLRQIRDAEIAQAIGRPRAVRAPADRPKELYLLADVVPDLVVSDVTDLRTLLERFAEAEAREAGPLPMNRRDLVARAPYLVSGLGGWPVNEGRQRELARGAAMRSVARAIEFREDEGGRRNLPLYTSLGEIAGYHHVCGIISRSADTFEIVVSNQQIEGDLDALKAAIRRPDVVYHYPKMLDLAADVEAEMAMGDEQSSAQSAAEDAAFSRVLAAIQVLHALNDELEAMPEPRRWATVGPWIERWIAAKEQVVDALVAYLDAIPAGRANRWRDRYLRKNGEVLSDLAKTWRTCAIECFLDLVTPCIRMGEDGWVFTYADDDDGKARQLAMADLVEAWLMYPDCFTDEMRAAAPCQFLQWCCDQISKMTDAERAELKARVDA